MLQLPVLLGALAALLAPAPDETDIDDVVREWKRAQRKASRVLVEERERLRAFGAHDHPEVVEELLEHLEECELVLRPAVREALAGMRAPASLALLLEDGLGSDEELVREHVALAVAAGLPPGDGWGPALLALLAALAGGGDDVPTLLEVAQRELCQLVDELPPEMRFNLVTFSDRADLWRGELAGGERKHRTAAKKEILDWSPRGGTNLHAALELVFELAQQELDGERDAAERAPDTLFVLTDGAPSMGAIRDPALLLAYVAERNRDLDLRLHVVAFHEDPTGFLEKLAGGTGGRVVEPLE